MSPKDLIAASLCAAYLLASSAAFSAEREFAIKDEKNRDIVSFTSDAPLELINGRTGRIEGQISLDESMDLSKNVKASFEVDLSSIDTGIELRNEHMRDNFLQTKQFPKASFVLKKLLNPPKKLKAGEKVKINAQGDFSLHGKTMSKTIPIELTYMTKCPATEAKRPGCDLIQFKATFPVAFKDYGIPRPEAVFQKLADEVIVTVSATAYNQIGDSSSKDAGKASESKKAK